MSAPSSWALALSVPAAMVTVGVRTVTIAGSDEVTVSVVPPAGAGCVRLIGSDVVRVYGALRMRGTEMVLLLTVTEICPAPAPSRVRLRKVVPVESPTIVQVATLSPGGIVTVAGALTPRIAPFDGASETTKPAPYAGTPEMARTVAVPPSATSGVLTSVKSKGIPMENAALPAVASPGDVARSTQLVAATLTVRSLKVATPATALRVVVPPGS